MAAAENVRSRGRVLRGQYVGVFRSQKGRIKGLFLRSDHEEYAINLPKHLCTALQDDFVPEAMIQVWAYREKDTWRGINVLPWGTAEARSHLSQRGASTALAAPPGPTATPICIQVCRKGACTKRGGKEIWQFLRSTIAANPELQHVSIEAAGCMKACKKGPNLRVLPDGKRISHVNPAVATNLLSAYQ